MEKEQAGLGIGSIALLWGIITQALVWAGVIHWPWLAIWGPLLILISIVVIAIVAALLVAFIMWLFGGKR